MKKFVLKLDLVDEKDKRKALKTVAALQGIDEITMDMIGKKITIIGTVDPVSVVSKLRKFWQRANIVSVGPIKLESEKKEEPKKEEAKKEDKKEEAPKEEAKKEEGKKEETPKEDAAKKDEGKKDEGKKDEEKKAEPQMLQARLQPQQLPLPLPQPVPQPQPLVGMMMPYRPYYPPPMNTYRPYYPQQNMYYHYQHSMEENPNSCIIC